MKHGADTSDKITGKAELLRQSEERFCRLAEQLPGITYIVDLLPEPHTVYISPQIQTMLGFTQQEWLSTPPLWIQQVAPKDREHIVEEVLRHNQTADPFFLEYRVVTREGKQLWVRNSATYQRNAEGIPTTVHGVIQDITEQKEAETALRDSELRFRHLLQEVEAVAIQGYGPDGTTQYWNQASEQLYGYTAEEAIGQNLLDLIIPPEMQEGVREAIQAMAERGEPIPSAEVSLMRKDGSRVSVHSSHVVVTPPGQPMELFCVDIDLTERQQAEQTQKQNEDRYRELHKLLRSVADVMPDMLWAKDLDRKYIFANRAMCEGLLLARDTEEPIGKTDLFFAQRQRDLYPDDPDWHTFGEICADSDSLVIDSGQTRQFEESGNVRGKFLLLDVIKTPLCNEQGEMIGTVGTGRDITERRKAESILKVTQQSYQNLLNSITEAIYVQNPSGEFIEINKGAELMYGYTREELLGKNPGDVAASGRNDMAAILRMSKEVFDTGVSARFPFWAVRKNGEVFPKEVILNKGKYFSQDVLIAVARDISERVQAESEKERLQTQLLQAQKLESVGRLAGGVAHDFNNLLQAIFGNAELALDVLPPDSPAFDNVEEIRKTAIRSANLTKQLLAFARKQAVIPQVLDLNQMIESMLKMLKRLIGEGVQLDWRPQPDLPSIKMDPTQIDQILVNLCLNARDSVEGEGRIILTTEVVAFDAVYCAEHIGFTPGKFVHLSIHDNGSGMEACVIEHIFEPFFSTKKMGHGTGLGLATVYGIVQQNKGIIRADSSPGKGATFHIYLPVCSQGIVSATETEIPTPGGQGQESILVVEDDEEILRLTEHMLKQLGYSVSAAASPKEAIRLAKEHSGDLHLLLTDVVMPEMNGHALSVEIKALFPKVKCLFMSGYTATIIASQSVVDEGVHFFQKPFTRQELSAKVRAILDRD